MSLDPAWVSTAATIMGAGFAAFIGTKVAIARIEERQSALRDRVTNLESDYEQHSLELQNHGSRISVLEDRGRRGQPVDYVR